MHNTEDHRKKRPSHSKQPSQLKKKIQTTGLKKDTDRDMKSSKIEHLSTKIKLKRRSSNIQITDDNIILYILGKK